MMEIAVGLLKEDPKGPLQPARTWAVDVISYYSKDGVPLSDDASLALGGHRTDLSGYLARLTYGKTFRREVEELMKSIEHGPDVQAPSSPAPE